MDPRTLYTVDVVGGPAWKADLPPEQQDLADHFTMMGTLFSDGELLANGPVLETGHGFYLYHSADIDRVHTIVDADPGMRSGVLAAASIDPWHILLDGSATPLTGKTLVIADYTPGPAYARDRSMNEQDEALLGPHVHYVGDKAQQHQLWLGGPVDPEAGRGRYVFAVAGGLPAVQAIVDADPGRTSGLFHVTLTTWQPFQSQPLPAARP